MNYEDYKAKVIGKKEVTDKFSREKRIIERFLWDMSKDMSYEEIESEMMIQLKKMKDLIKK